MTERLFVIGNGFDLHHGIPSRYSDFGRYVETVAPTVHQLILDYLFVDEDFWNCFEERLATFDYDRVIDHAENYLVPYSAEDWSDAYHHDFEYEIQQVVGGLSNNMRNRFAEWIRLLPVPTPGSVQQVRCVDRTAKFLTFNYTPTLQTLYGVPASQVLHIHGSARDPNAEIVLGHGWERQAEETLERLVDEETDTRVAGGYRLIDDYFAETFKPTEKIIDQNLAFFDGLSNVSEIWVLGHSLADVDARYFEEVVARVSPSTRWIISCYNTPNLEQQRFSRYGVAPNMVQYAPLATL